MNKLISIAILTIATPLMAQQAVTLTVTFSSDHVWALSQDYVDYQDAGRGTNGVTTNTLTKLQWFTKNGTNLLISAADRRVKIRRNQLSSQVMSNWPNLTPAQMTNVLNALP